MRKYTYLVFITAVTWFILTISMVYAANIPDGTGVRIGIIDTGVLENPGIWPEDRIEAGKNYVFPELTTADKIGHGTRITSLIIGAKTDEGSILGTAPGATAIPLVYQSRYPSGVTRNGGIELMSQAIIDAVDIFQCKVICISSGTTIESSVLEKAVIYAEEKGAVVVAAAGNDNNRKPERFYYPATFNTVIGVGAVDKNKQIADFSQHHGVFAVAEGKDLPALDMDGRIKIFSGTSYANARMAGIVAMLFSAAPDSTPEEIREALALSAEDLGETGYDPVYGWGAVDPQKAVDMITKGKTPGLPDLALKEETEEDSIFPYKDVLEAAWYSKSIKSVFQAGIMKGVSDSRFAPDEVTTRGMLVTVLYRISGEPDEPKGSGYSHNFIDVVSGAYYESAVAWARENGIVQGTGPNTFEPDEFITREQMAQILYQYSRYESNEEIVVANSIENFSDWSQASVWARDGLNWAVGQGLMKGKGRNDLEPKACATRGEMAVMLSTLFQT